MNPEYKERIHTALLLLLFFSIIFLSCFIASAQDNHEPLVLDVKVQRIPVSFFDQETYQVKESLSSSVCDIPESLERVYIIFVGGEVILLMTELDTLELILCKKGEGPFNTTVFYNPENNQKYWVKREWNARYGSFYLFFIPIAHVELYTFRSMSYKPQRTYVFETKNLYSINITSL